jgi:hypothetical protein
MPFVICRGSFRRRDDALHDWPMQPRRASSHIVRSLEPALPLARGTEHVLITVLPTTACEQIVSVRGSLGMIDPLLDLPVACHASRAN